MTSATYEIDKNFCSVLLVPDQDCLAVIADAARAIKGVELEVYPADTHEEKQIALTALCGFAYNVNHLALEAEPAQLDSMHSPIELREFATEALHHGASIVRLDTPGDTVGFWRNFLKYNAGWSSDALEPRSSAPR